MVNFLYDKRNDFGTIETAGDFSNIINMGEASAERMTVDLKLPEGRPFISADGVILTVKGCDTEDGEYKTITQSGIVSAAMVNEGYGLPMPKTRFQYLKVEIEGNFEGKVQAHINSYLGK